ncbi:dephospho-CoA kinase [Raineyella fluvialis]|nr:dephospho-CoA kinase [Raineyella fluvialis]
MIGLTGGIGSGKSTVAKLFAERGALVIDADALAREVVERGSQGLAAVRERFGADVVREDGSLDRAALGAVVFADPAARRDLEAITHPLIRARTQEIIAAAPVGTIVVHDIPLLVEIGAGPQYHLVVAVDVDVEERVRRLAAFRGLAAEDARARIAHQATREARLAVADAVVDNNGDPGALAAQVEALWQRFVAFEANVRAGIPADLPTPVHLLAGRVTGSGAEARRLLARIAYRLGPLLGVEATYDHVGPTAVPGLTAPALIHLLIGVPDTAPAQVDDLRAALGRLGHPEGADGVFLSCDPGRPVRIRLCQEGSAEWRDQLFCRDWLVAEPSAREAAATAHRAAAETSSSWEAYESKVAGWWQRVRPTAEAWASQRGWRPQGTSAADVLAGA